MEVELELDCQGIPPSSELSDAILEAAARKDSAVDRCSDAL